MHPGNHVKLPFPDNCVFIRAIIYKVLKTNQALCPAFALNCFKPLHQYCQSYHPHFIKKQMQKGSDLPRFTQLTHCIARIQARYVYLQSPCSSLPIRMGAEQPNIREKGWGDTEKVVKNSIRSRSLLSLHQDAKRSGSRYFLAHGSLYFPFLMLSMVYCQKETLGRECTQGLSDILKRYTSATHTPNFKWAL